jgi:hypothetical protein
VLVSLVCLVSVVPEELDVASTEGEVDVAGRAHERIRDRFSLRNLHERTARRTRTVKPMSLRLDQPVVSSSTIDPHGRTSSPSPSHGAVCSVWGERPGPMRTNGGGFLPLTGLVPRSAGTADKTYATQPDKVEIFG